MKTQILNVAYTHSKQDVHTRSSTKLVYEKTYAEVRRALGHGLLYTSAII